MSHAKTSKQQTHNIFSEVKMGQKLHCAIRKNPLDEKGFWAHSIYEAFQVFDKDAQ